MSDPYISSKPPRPWVQAEYQVKGELLLNSEMAFGWCWSPDRKNERLRVNLLIDGVRRGTVTAARLRLDLVRHDVCDGYHGFSIPLPSPMPNFATVEIQEHVTGIVFGRVLSDATQDIATWHTKVGGMSRELDGLHRQIGALAYSVKNDALRTAFSATGYWLTDQSGLRSDPTSRKRASLCLPFVQQPRISFILDTGGGEDPVLDSLPALAPLLTHYVAEVVVSDRGTGMASAALASIQGLSYCLATQALAAARSNQAASAARGGILMFLRAEAVSLLGLAKLLDRTVPPQNVIIGGAVELAARRAGLGAVFAPATVAPYGCGATLIVCRDLFKGLGALDPALEDGVALPMLDFALRARQAGHDVTWLRDSTEPPYHPSADVVAARQKFLARWSRPL